MICGDTLRDIRKLAIAAVAFFALVGTTQVANADVTPPSGYGVIHNAMSLSGGTCVGSASVKYHFMNADLPFGIRFVSDSACNVDVIQYPGAASDPIAPFVGGAGPHVILAWEENGDAAMGWAGFVAVWGYMQFFGQPSGVACPDSGEHASVTLEWTLIDYDYTPVCTETWKLHAKTWDSNVVLAWPVLSVGDNGIATCAPFGESWVDHADCYFSGSQGVPTDFIPPTSGTTVIDDLAPGQTTSAIRLTMT